MKHRSTKPVFGERTSGFARRLEMAIAALLAVLLLMSKVAAAEQEALERLVAGDDKAVIVISPIEGAAPSGPQVFGDGAAEYIPASVAKLVTSAAALYILGSDFPFVTEFYADGKIEGRRLEGNLYIKGYGDPYLVSEQWKMIADEIPLDRISGDIIVDGSYFAAKTGLAPPTEITRPYAALNGAFATNFNSFAFRFADGRFSFEPQTPLAPFIVINFIESASGPTIGRKFEPVSVRPKTGVPVEGGRLVITYRGPKKGSTRWRRVNIGADPAAAPLYAGSLFSQFFIDRGGAVGGKIKQTPVTESAKILFRHTNNRTLGEVIEGLMTYSNNFIANQLLIILGAKKGGEADAAGGIAVVNRYLSKLGVGGIRLTEASGLDPENRLPPKSLAELICRKQVLDSGLYKLMPTEAGGRIRKKTGTMKRVKNIAGYALDRNGRPGYCFAYYCNGDCSRIDKKRSELFRILLDKLDDEDQ